MFVPIVTARGLIVAQRGDLATTCGRSWPHMAGLSGGLKGVWVPPSLSSPYRCFELIGPSTGPRVCLRFAWQERRQSTRFGPSPVEDDGPGLPGLAPSWRKRETLRTVSSTSSSCPTELPLVCFTTQVAPQLHNTSHWTCPLLSLHSHQGWLPAQEFISCQARAEFEGKKLS